MSTAPQFSQTQPPGSGPKRLERASAMIAAGVAVYLVVAYLVLPRAWHVHEKRHPALLDAPWLTHTSSGIPGDPLNIALVGAEQDIHRAMLAAGWYPAEPITLASSLRMAADVVFKKPFDDAPVSSLYLWGRKEDLAFEQMVGDNPRHRHHVRYWRSAQLDADGRPLWLGAATLDVRVGLSHTTGQITHHIGSDVDAERDKILHEIQKAGGLATVYWIDGFNPELEGRNGGGDRWHTDGRLAVGVIQPGGRASTATQPG